MRIFWFPRLQMDIDKFHITTWREMCRELRLKGHTVEIAIAGKPGKAGIFDAPYVHIPIIRLKFLRLITFWIFGFTKSAIQYLRLRPDVLILDIFTIWFGLLSTSLGHKHQCTIVLDNRTPYYEETSSRPTIRDVILRLYTRIAYIFCQLLGGRVTTITEYYKASLCKDFKVSAPRIGVWGSGVDIARFNPQNYGESENHFPWSGKFVIMQHGEISYNRGICETIKAMSLINKTDIALVVIGSPINNEKINNEINELIHNLNLSNKVHRIPSVPYTEVPRYLSSADCAIMAYPNIEYWNNNNPIKLLEYLGMGKVVICTNMWAFRDVCGSKRCAVYVDNNEPETLAKAIIHCYYSRDALTEWGSEGIDIVRERFTWKKQTENLLDFIEETRP